MKPYWYCEELGEDFLVYAVIDGGAFAFMLTYENMLLGTTVWHTISDLSAAVSNYISRAEEEAYIRARVHVDFDSEGLTVLPAKVAMGMLDNPGQPNSALQELLTAGKGE